MEMIGFTLIAVADELRISRSKLKWILDRNPGVIHDRRVAAGAYGYGIRVFSKEDLGKIRELLKRESVEEGLL